jgi:hypothetical protein
VLYLFLQDKVILMTPGVVYADIASPDFGDPSGEDDFSKSSSAVRPGRNGGNSIVLWLPTTCFC